MRKPYWREREKERDPERGKETELSAIPPQTPFLSPLERSDGLKKRETRERERERTYSPRVGRLQTEAPLDAQPSFLPVSITPIGRVPRSPERQLARLPNFVL
jgi:hypothetical protein